MLPSPRAHARRLGAGGGSGRARPGAPAISAGGAANVCPPPLPGGAGGCRHCGKGGHRGGQQGLPPTCSHAKRRREAATGGGKDHWWRGAPSGVPQPRPRTTPSAGAAKASGAATIGSPMTPRRGRRCRCPRACRDRGGRPRPPTPQRRGGDAAVAAAVAVMSTPVDAGVSVMAAPAAGRSGLSAAHTSGGRAAPGARPPWRPPRRERRRCRLPALGGYFLATSWRHPRSVRRHKVANGVYWEDETNAP